MTVQWLTPVVGFTWSHAGGCDRLSRQSFRWGAGSCTQRGKLLLRGVPRVSLRKLGSGVTLRLHEEKVSPIALLCRLEPGKGHHVGTCGCSRWYPGEQVQLSSLPVASGVERTRSSGCVGLLSQLLKRLRQEAYVQGPPEQLAACLRVKPAR